MKGYLSIGKVSKLKNVSIKSLRYYDHIGVFRPAYINEKTNYRYYTEDQLYLLDAVQLCIELGIPLSRFEEYRDGDGNLNIQKLLFDGKDLAEKKIRSMRESIDQLQRTLERLEQEEKPSANKSGDIRQKTMDERYVMISEFDEVTTANRYNHMLLSLFVNAEKSGCNAGYPAGLLYDRTEKGLKKYVFTTLLNADPSTLGTGCRILPKGSYYTLRSTDHRIEEAPELFAQILASHPGENYILVESDVLDEKKKGLRELQLVFVP